MQAMLAKESLSTATLAVRIHRFGPRGDGRRLLAAVAPREPTWMVAQPTGFRKPQTTAPAWKNVLACRQVIDQHPWMTRSIPVAWPLTTT